MYSRKHNRQSEKIRYERRKAQGICVWCGGDALENLTLCKECNDKRKSINKENYEWYKANHICTCCHKNPTYERLWCDDCAEKNAKKRVERNLKLYGKPYLDTWKKYKDRNMQRGKCPNCGREPKEGCKYCQRCITKGYERRRINRERKMSPEGKLDRSEWVSYGLCYICGKPRGDFPKKICADCYSKSKIVDSYHKNEKWSREIDAEIKKIMARSHSR